MKDCPGGTWACVPAHELVVCTWCREVITVYTLIQVGMFIRTATRYIRPHPRA